MALKYVVAGTSPLAWWSNDLHLLLKDAVKAKWTTDITDPPVAYVNFNDDWFTDSQDIEFTFLHLRDDFNPNRRSVGWNRRNTATFIDVHMFVRGMGNTQPAYVYKAKKAFEDIIELNNTTLLAPAIVTIDTMDPMKEHDHQRTMYHYRFSITVWYDKVKVDLP
jgi:hypothetical protein